MELTFMDLFALHLGYILSSLFLVVLFAAVMFATAFLCALYDLAKERRTRRRKESRNA
ncbi:membrane protein [Arthrobacter phage Tuck]|uniref:Membrane protein n=2 Tax=Yangvirus TaxID=2733221 RepID=A0A9E8M9G9_9CAUD|nr:membrane protein [Arthrobacter phage Phives]QOP65192.1 membrane protein [Arthrobacter phage Phives]WAB10838.1 membrane protein [Arthrobacter phage Tuck]